MNWSPKALGLRRRRAEDLGLPRPFVEALVSLEPPCDWNGHAAGRDGCQPEYPGEYVVRLRPHCARAAVPGMPHVMLVVCLAQAIHLRGAQRETFPCACGAQATWGEVIDFLGPVEEYYP